jgi:uncharacterized SAM-binding protein YcdF (DUF218 family)
MFLLRFMRGWRRGLAITFLLFLAFCIISAQLFIFPATGAPARVDAIVVLGGSGDRLNLGMQLAREGRAPYLVLSLGLPWLPAGICQDHVGSAKVICFQPDPDTTQGEARGASRLAKEHDWTSLVVVTTQDQVWRAKLRFKRCYSGNIYGIASSIPWFSWPYALAYQWVSTIKAETLQRGC